MSTAPFPTEESSTTTPTSAAFNGPLDDAPHRNTPGASARSTTPPLLRPPAGQAFTSHVKQWGPNEVASFLNMYKCDQYTALFHQNDIDGKVLLDLDMPSLKEIGITKIGDRVKLLGGVRDLRKRAARATPPPSALGSRGLSVGVTATDAYPLPPLDHDGRGSQVPKRLAEGLVSTLFRASRPPPLKLGNSLSSTDSASLTVASPSSRSVTPKLVYPQAFAKGYSGMSAHDSNGATLRPPAGRDSRRSPSPAGDHTRLDSNLPWSRTDAQATIKVAERRRPGGLPRFADGSYRSEHPATLGLSTSPTHPSTASREGAPYAVHPFASVVTRKEGSHEGDSHKRPRAALPGNGQHDGANRPGQPIPLEDLRRHLIKFINSEDGTTKTVNVANLTSGVEVLDSVLKKFGKWQTGRGGNLSPDSDGDNDQLEVDGWGVFVRTDSGEEDVALSESALLDICHGHRGSRLFGNQDPSMLRERGLLLRRVSHSVNRKNMADFFGPNPPPPHSPNSPSYYGVPRLGRKTDDHDSWSPDSSNMPISNKQTNRASTLSIMSGLNVPGVVDSSPSSTRSPSIGTGSSRTRKVYNFFGHRPPSELISNHLADYFPSARKRDLEKTVRQSMLRLSQGHNERAHGSSSALVGLGAASPLSASLENVASPSRKGRPPSTRTVSSSTTPAAIPEETEISSDGPARQGIRDHSHPSPENHAPLLPPFESTGQSLVDSLQEYSPAPSTVRAALRPGRRGSTGSNLSRISILSSLRRNRDQSDTASLLTVDEITAEVENRRASMATVDDVYSNDTPTPHDSDETLSEFDADEEDDDDMDSDGSSYNEDKGPNRAYTSAGSRRNIKWIKGALIGAGSFGSVYLGMDAQSGLLMAVKQVELHSGDARNEERKRNMVQALEREIELLKDLQHENIVQYLDSATDGNYLNIFLEYVPGGSVAALLNNYGAFEEALVRNFVRQILTGLNYLHERDIIHRDIKGANILVDNKGGIKISDFGISKKAENSLMASKMNRPSLQGSVFWMAPEVVKQTSYTSKADIWSVGCLVVEMLTGTHPWADLTQMQAIFRIGSINPRPATPTDISPDARDFLQCTFEINYIARSTAAQLLEHHFIAVQHSTSIPLEQANATLEAVAAARNQPMPPMPAMTAS